MRIRNDQLRLQLLKFFEVKAAQQRQKEEEARHLRLRKEWERAAKRRALALRKREQARAHALRMQELEEERKQICFCFERKLSALVKAEAKSAKKLMARQSQKLFELIRTLKEELNELISQGFTWEMKKLVLQGMA